MEGPSRSKFLKLLAVGLLCLSATDLFAGKVVLRIRAGNPIDQPQTVEIRSELPPRVKRDDIIDLDGLELGYDIKQDVYYVKGQIELGPKEARVYNVEINDIWRIPPEQLETLRKRAARLTVMLQGYEYHESATQLLADIRDRLAKISAFQQEYAIGKAQPIQHIRAYEENLKWMQRVKRDVGRIENLVLGTGQDPGELVGEVRRVERPEPEPAGEDYDPAIIRITVRNTSPTEARTVNIKRELPEEIRSYDVTDTGGLELGIDEETGRTVVYANNLELQPDETRTFDVQIRDKWNVNQPRIAKAREDAAALVEQLGRNEGFESIHAMLRDVVEQLEAMSREEGPRRLDEQYVAFYREQADRLDELEQKIYRVEAATQPMDKTSPRGFQLKAPSMKTTWMIIYIILVFLAIVSLLFFFRWYGRSKAEMMSTDEPSGSSK